MAQLDAEDVELARRQVVLGANVQVIRECGAGVRRRRQARRGRPDGGGGVRGKKGGMLPAGSACHHLPVGQILVSTP